MGILHVKSDKREEIFPLKKFTHNIYICNTCTLHWAIWFFKVEFQGLWYLQIYSLFFYWKWEKFVTGTITEWQKNDMIIIVIVKSCSCARAQVNVLLINKLQLSGLAIHAYIYSTLNHCIFFCGFFWMSFERAACNIKCIQTKKHTWDAIW